MVGPPGSGKSMLAARLPAILPPLTPAELLEISMVHSVAGEIEGARSPRRPFRAPHHSASMAALIGGGLRAKPGEVTLAHNGVLFLDELPEFQPQALDALRQPLETGEVRSPAPTTASTYPGALQLVAAMNPCRCGRAGEPGTPAARRARAAPPTIRRRISGPLLDRIDLHIEVPAVTAADLVLPPPARARPRSAARVHAPARCRRRATRALGAAAGAHQRAGAGQRSTDRGDPMPRALRCCARRRRQCGSRRAAFTACSGSRARWRISTARRRSAACTSPRRCPTGRSPMRCGERLRDDVLMSDDGSGTP